MIRMKMEANKYSPRLFFSHLTLPFAVNS